MGLSGNVDGGRTQAGGHRAAARRGAVTLDLPCVRRGARGVESGVLGCGEHRADLWRRGRCNSKHRGGNERGEAQPRRV